MTDEERVLSCQREIRRLRSVGLYDKSISDDNPNAWNGVSI